LFVGASPTEVLQAQPSVTLRLCRGIAKPDFKALVQIEGAPVKLRPSVGMPVICEDGKSSAWQHPNRPARKNKAVEDCYLASPNIKATVKAIKTAAKMIN